MAQGKDANRPKAAFPKVSLEDALAVPEALQRNGGQPLSAIDMATAVNRSPGSSAIRTLSSASSAYGLTGGSYKSSFSMKDGGRRIVEPTSTEEKRDALVAAALRPPTFKAIFEYYKGKKFPERQFFINTVTREFEVDPKQAETCVDIFTANMAFANLVRDTPGGPWLVADPESNPVPTGTVNEEPPTDADQEIDDPESEAEGAIKSSPSDVLGRKRPNRIFIGHGRNAVPLDQLTKMLSNLGMPFKVAEAEANVGRPISQKVRETMEECGAAILIFSADLEYFDKEGSPVWKSSENVANELGAASVMYDNRIILFKEEEVDLASNYSGIGYITFEKDNLDARMNDLLKELVALKMLKLSLGGGDE